MELIKISQGKYSVLAEILLTDEGERTIQILNDFENAEAKYSASIQGFAKLFELFSQNGKQGMKYDWFHKADDKNHIYQFIKGSLRVLCFFNANGDAVILSHYEIKKGQKLSSKAINKAVKIRSRYLNDYKNNNIKIGEK